MGDKPLAAGRRKHNPILARDTGDRNKMFVVRDEVKRREILEKEHALSQSSPPIIDTRKPVNQLRDNDITDVHEVQKRHSHRAIENRRNETIVGENPPPRRGWRK